MKIIKYLILSLLIVFFLACPDNPTEPQGNVVSVSVTGSTSVQVSSTITLTANVEATGGADETVTWSSSDPTVATVDANGVVTGVAAGSVTITATSAFDSNVSGTIMISVSVMESVQSVSVAGDASVQAGNTITLTADVEATGGADETVTWSSSDTNVATVDANGVVTGVAAGSVTITATSVFDNTKMATHSVMVTTPSLQIYGYRLTVSTPNNDDDATDVILQVAEGGIHDGSNMVDLLAGVDPTTDTTVEHGGPVEKFNDGSDNQSLAQLFHSVQNTNTKTIQVLGSNRLIASSGVFRIRIIGRDSFQERGNGLVVTLLNENGDPIGTASDTSSGFVKNNGAHDGFVVDFRARDGVVLTQPTIFDLSGSLPALPDAN